MPAVDQCHEQVKRALQKDGLRIESDPFYIVLEKRAVYIDLEVSRLNNGSRKSLMLMEVKCFPDRNSTTRDVYTAIGQYLIYRTGIERARLPYDVYLAVPEIVYKTVFDNVVMQVIQDSKIRLVIINLETETVVQWIE